MASKPRIVRTQIAGLEPVFVALANSAVFPGMPPTARATEESTGLLLALVCRSTDGRGWIVMPEASATSGEESHVWADTLFAAAQIIGHARARFLRDAAARRAALVQA